MLRTLVLKLIQILVEIAWACCQCHLIRRNLLLVQWYGRLTHTIIKSLFLIQYHYFLLIYWTFLGHTTEISSASTSRVTQSKATIVKALDKLLPR